MVQPLMILLMAFLVAGCSAGHSARLPATFSPAPIKVVITADPQLNRFDSRAHALSLCLYQLKAPDAFTELAREKGGVARLLDCGRFDGSVVKTKQIVVQPGQELQENGDRGEGVRYIGVATGYYYLGRKKVTDLSLLSSDNGGTSGGGVVRIELGPQELRCVRVE